jgi:O-antigen/teichoic acid export membrane protein
VPIDINGENLDESHIDKLTISGGSKKSMEDSMPGGPEGESIAKGTFVILLARIFGLACTFITMNIALPRLMPEGNFGDFQVLMSFVLAFEIALHYGLPAAVSKFIAEDRDFLGYFLTKGFKLQIWFSLILFGISLVICPIATLYFKADLRFALLFAFAMVDIPAYAMYNIRMSVLNGLRRFTKESYTVIWYNGTRTIMTVGGVWWAYSQGKPELMIFVALLANLISSFIGLYWSVQYTKGVEGYREEKGMLQSIIRFITPNIIAMFVYQALLKVDLWCVKGFITSGMPESKQALSDSILGSYAFAGLIALIPSLLYHSLYPALFPTISYYLGQGDLRRVRNIITQATKAGFIVLLPISVAMCGTAKEIFLILAGHKYDHAWIYLGVLVFSMAAYTLYLSASIIIIASNHPEYPLKNVTGLLISAFVLNWLFMDLIPFNVFGTEDPQYFEIARALAGPSVAIIVGLAGTWFFARWILKTYGVFAKISDIVRISLAVIIPAPLLWIVNLAGIQTRFVQNYMASNPDISTAPVFVKLTGWIGFGVIGEYLIYFFLYSILLFLFGAFDPDEKAKILKLVRRILRIQIG